MHVMGKGGEAKLSLRPVRILRSSYNASVTHDIERIAREHEALLIDLWERVHGRD